jgi:hypothetical protein
MEVVKRRPGERRGGFGADSNRISRFACGALSVELTGPTPAALGPGSTAVILNPKQE